jgi:membrane protease YdiL (CAAX protease family)
MTAPASERRFFSRTAVVLWGAAVIGTACVLPYVLTLVPSQGVRSGRVALSLPALLALSIAQSAVLLGVMTFSGLWAARRLGMGAPLLDAWLHGQPRPVDVRRTVLLAFAWGLGSGLASLALDLGVLGPLSRDGVGRLLRQPQPPAWMGLLASIEGGVTEEIELRLFLLSWLALFLRRVTRSAERRATRPLDGGVFWTANILAALLFGLGHLPMTSRLVALSPVVVSRALILNGLIGLVAGCFFRRRGIETAMAVHFGADLVLHVAAPLGQGWLLSLAHLS